MRAKRSPVSWSWRLTYYKIKQNLCLNKSIRSCSLLIVINEQVVELGLADSGHVDQASCGLDVLFLVFNFSRVQDMDNVTLAHVPHIEVVEHFDDFKFSAVSGMHLVVEQTKDVAERYRPKQLFRVVRDDVFGMGHSMFDAEFDQESSVSFREKLPYDVFERVTVHVLSLVFFLGLGSWAFSFFDALVHHLGQSPLCCFGSWLLLCLCDLLCLSHSFPLFSILGVLLLRSQARRCIIFWTLLRVSAILCLTCHFLLHQRHIHNPISWPAIFQGRAGMLDRKIMIPQLSVWRDLCFSKAIVLLFQFQEATDIAFPCEWDNKSIAHGDHLMKLIGMSFREDIHLDGFLIHSSPRVPSRLNLLNLFCKLTFSIVEHHLLIQQDYKQNLKWVWIYHLGFDL